MKNVNTKTNRQELAEIDKLIELQESYICNLQIQLSKEKSKLVELEHSRIVTANKVIIEQSKYNTYKQLLNISMLERHCYAPELNKLHIYNKLLNENITFKCPGITDIKQAVQLYIKANY